MSRHVQNKKRCIANENWHTDYIEMQTREQKL